MRRISHRPTPPGKLEILNRGWAAEDVLQTEVVGDLADQVAAFAPEQPFAIPIDQDQPRVAIEGKNGDVDLGHHRAEQHGRLLRAKTLAAQRLGERVDLEHHLPQRVVGHRAAGADREVVFAKRGEEIRHRLQRPDDPVAQRNRHTQPQAEQNRADRDADQPRILADPQQHE